MAFTTMSFLFVFLPLTILGYYLIHPKLKNLFLLAASLAFYAWGEPKFILIFMVSIAANYTIALLINKLENRVDLKRLVLIIALFANVGLLFYYKYLMFAVTTVNQVFGRNISIPNIALPLGISFFTFRSISYILDVYWGTSEAQKNPINAALYISFFPQVSMGPITKSYAFLPQLSERGFHFNKFSDGIRRFILGMAKKLIIADVLSIIVNPIFALPHDERTVIAAWCGVIGYILQLFFDFSGYSDMAIGIGKMFGFDTPENFDYPYMSKGIGEFWGRWHITLGAWLKDYIYTPIFRALLDKKKPVFWCDIFGLLCVWLIAGVWHGAAWHYVAYGLYYFLFIALERTVDYYKKERRKKLKLKKQPETKVEVVLAHIYFVIVLIFGQLLFRVDTLGNYIPYIRTMFGFGGNQFTNQFTNFTLRSSAGLFFIGILFCFPIGKKVKSILEKNKYLNSFSEYLVQPIAYLALFIVSISYMLISTSNPFLYFNF